VRDIRGNVPTRLRKLDEGGYDGILLACAGLERLGLGDRIDRALDSPWVGAAGQGAIAVEGRADDVAVLERVRPLEHRASRMEVDAERTVLHALQGGCSLPFGARARVGAGVLDLTALALDPASGQALRVERSGEPTLVGSRRLGRVVARDLVDRGVLELLAGEAP